MKIDISDLESEHKKQVSLFTQYNVSSGTIKPITVLTAFKSDNFKLPVITSGRLLSSGVFYEEPYGRIEIQPNELKKAYLGWKDKKIFKFHDAYWNKISSPISTSADTAVGRIVETVWDDLEKGVDYIAEIYDRDIAYKIYTRMIEQISAGFMNDVSEKDGYYYKINLIPHEASLVIKGRDPKATVNVKGISY